MEHAIWIKRTGEKKYVNSKEVKEELGEEAARSEQYECPSKKCRVRLRPVFPKKVRHNAKEAHSDHFRAKHTTDCGGDGQRDDAEDSSSGDETNAKPRHDIVKRGDYPMRYGKRVRVRRGALDEGLDVAGKLDQRERKGREKKGNQVDEHTSEPETGHIQKIVEAYEDPPEELSRMKLHLPESLARNYKDAFVDVDQAVDKEGRVEGYYIYKGSYGDHTIYADNAIAIIFDCLSGNGKILGTWIEKTLEPESARKEIRELLKRAKREKNATVYAFGRFQRFGTRKYSIEIEAFGDLWITFPKNSGLNKFSRHS